MLKPHFVLQHHEVGSAMIPIPRLERLMRKFLPWIWKEFCTASNVMIQFV
jgi:hypothetical protein